MFRDFPRTMGFDGCGLSFHSGRWCGLHAEFYGLNSTSIMGSDVLRSGTLLQFSVWSLFPEIVLIVQSFCLLFFLQYVIYCYVN